LFYQPEWQRRPITCRSIAIERRAAYVATLIPLFRVKHVERRESKKPIMKSNALLIGKKNLTSAESSGMLGNEHSCNGISTG